MTQSRDDVLHGWKDIAAYVSRDVSTVKRWEKQRGLPVRRVPGGGRANVYAHPTELNQWLTSAAFSAPDQQNGVLSSYPEHAAQRARLGDATQTAARRDWPRGSTGALTVSCMAVIALLVSFHFRSARIAMPAPQPVSVARHPSRVPEVEDLYLRGVYSYERRTADSLNHAESLFQEAVTRDSQYAPAYAGLAVTYNLMREFGSMPSPEAYAKSRYAAERAISLDPNLSEAHAALGFVEFFWDWKSAAAEREFRTAIVLDPGSVLARHWYGSMLTHEGRFDDAIQQLDVAQRLEPNSTSILLARALALGFGGHRQQAIDLLHQIGEQDTEFSSVHLRLGTISMLEPCDLNMYFSEMEAWAILNHDHSTLASNREMQTIYKSAGAVPMWRATLRKEEQSHPSEVTGSMAAAQAELGNRDAAFSILQQLATDHATELIGINLRPQLKSLHADPRYDQLLVRMGLPPLPQS